MNIHKLFFLFLLPFFLHFTSSFAQNKNNIDSLLGLLKKDKPDTNKVKHLNRLCEQYAEIGNYDTVLLYSHQAIELGQKLNFKRGIADAYNNIAGVYDDQCNFAEALKNYFACLKIREEIGQKQGIAGSYNNIGLVYYDQGNYTEALKNYFASLKIKEAIGDKAGIARSYGNIGLVYSNLGNYPEALKNHFVCLKIMEETGNKKGIANSYNNIGAIYASQCNYPEALKNFLACLKIREAIGEKITVADSYCNIGNIYSTQGNYPEALKNYTASLKIDEEIGYNAGIADYYNNIGNLYYDQGNYPEALKNQLTSLKIREEIGDKAVIAVSYRSVGSVLTKQKKYNEAQKYLDKAKELSEIIGYKECLRDAYKGLAELDSAKGNFKGAYENHKFYTLYRDSLSNEESDKKIIQSQMTYDFEMKEASTKAEQDKKDATVQANLMQEKFTKYVITGIAVIILLASIILLVSNNGRHKLLQLAQRQELRKNIADDLHDEIGAGLTKITMICESGKAGLKKQYQIDVPFLDSISAQSRTISENLSEVIWATHPQNDNLLSLVSTIINYASTYLEDSSIRYTLDFPDEIKATKTNPNVNRNLFLIVKEALNNCVKHSKTDTVSIGFSLGRNKNYILTIKDNGIGFNTTGIHENGNGLRSLKNRASAINATFELRSEINKGTEIEVCGNL